MALAQRREYIPLCGDIFTGNETRFISHGPVLDRLLTELVCMYARLHRAKAEQPRVTSARVILDWCQLATELLDASP